MALHDGLDQCKAQAHPAVPLRGAWQAVKGLKIFSRNAAGTPGPRSQTVITTAPACARRVTCAAPRHGDARSPAGCVPRGATTCPRPAPPGHRCPGARQVGTGAGTFFGGHPEQVDRFHGPDIGLAGIEPAGQQDFVDQLVEFLDVAGDLVAEVRARLRPMSSRPMRMRVSGERNSWDTLASSDLPLGTAGVPAPAVPRR